MANVNMRSGKRNDNLGERTREVRMITSFSTDMQEYLLVENDSNEIVEKQLLSPIINVSVFDISTSLLIDSGSQISGVSEAFYNQLPKKCRYCL